MSRSPEDPRETRLPLGQRIFDNVFLLLVLGVLVMLVVFTGWGLWEIVAMPQGTLP
jgi:hypothetical protein